MSEAISKEPERSKLRTFKDVCRKWLYIENDEYIDVVFGVVFANRLDAKPVWLYLVAPPGGGKTEIVQSLDGHPSIYALSTLTPNTLISGKIQEPGQKEEDPSLLPKLDGKILVIKDFTVILKGRNEDIREIFGQFRDAYDGKIRKAYGTGKDKEYESKFGIIAAVTGEIDKHLRLLSSLGERFLIYRMPKLSEAEIEARTNLAAENKSAETQERELKEVAHAVLNLKSESASISQDLMKKLGKMARFIAVVRTEINRDRITREIQSPPDPEIPTRLVKQFVSLAQGIAMTREQTIVTEDEVRLVYRVALGSIPPMRLEVLRCLMAGYPKSMTSKSIAGKIRMGFGVINRCLGELYALGIVDKRKADAEPTTPWDWTVKSKYGDFLREIGI